MPRSASTTAASTPSTATPKWDAVSKLNSGDVDKFYADPDNADEIAILKEASKRTRTLRKSND